MLINDIRKYIIQPTLKEIDLYSLSAEILLAGTIMCETGCNYLKQINGPALSFYQIESTTFKDISIYLTNGMNKILADKVMSANCLNEIPKDPNILLWNIKLATCYARIIYYRNKRPLPDPADAQAMAQTHKEIYNTSKGKADAAHNAEIFRKIIDEG